jgi:hypothetical protein
MSPYARVAITVSVNSMSINWSTLFRQPQTYLLLTGVGLGYAGLIFLAGSRPLAWLTGGSISAVMVGTWATGFQTKPGLQSDSDLLDSANFSARLNQLNQQVPAQSRQTWEQAQRWATESQRFAERIYERDPLLQVELLEAMHTVLNLARQVAEGLKVMDEIETPTYRKLAQQRLNASRDRLQVSHAQLQQLQDQVALAGLDSTQGMDRSLPQRLQTLINANKQILEDSDGSPS